jgi:hypothetical protein
MFQHLFQTMTQPLAMLLFFFFLTARLTAAQTGPTLQFDYGAPNSSGNPLVKFMYFVPLISPEWISVSTNAGNTQRARVLSYVCQTNGKSFHVSCEFEFTGDGVQRNVFDHTPGLKRHDQELKAGKTLSHQIMEVTVQGNGQGIIEIEGITTNNVRTVNEIKMRFNYHGHSSPVNIDLQDISLQAGQVRYDNEFVARVNTLTFHRKAVDPRMDVTLDSVKRKDAGNTAWANFWGGVKGLTANMFLPPIRVPPEGDEVMMNFGQALANRAPSFTFPFATRLKDGTTTEP